MIKSQKKEKKDIFAPLAEVKVKENIFARNIFFPCERKEKDIFAHFAKEK